MDPKNFNADSSSSTPDKTREKEDIFKETHKTAGEDIFTPSTASSFSETEAQAVLSETGLFSQSQEQDSKIAPHPSTPITFIFLGLILASYFLTTVENNFAYPASWALLLGAFHPLAIQQGEWWRCITAVLLHANMVHLFNNSFGIFIFGQLMESLLGRSAFLGLILVSWFGSDLFSYLFLPGATIGASGVVYGFLGAYITQVLTLRVRQDKKIFKQELRGAIGFTVVFLVMNWMDRGQVNLWAHLGGFLSGCAYIFLLSLKRRAAKPML